MNRLPIPAPFLQQAADIAENFQLETTTLAGAELQKAFIEFLRTGAASEADPLDMLADLLVLVTRFHNSLVQANHRGTMCRKCAARFAAMLFDEIIQDASELSARQTAERKH